MKLACVVKQVVIFEGIVKLFYVLPSLWEGPGNKATIHPDECYHLHSLAGPLYLYDHSDWPHTHACIRAIPT